MEDPDLRTAFQKTRPNEGDYWTFTANQEVQFTQYQGAFGNRSGSTIQSLATPDPDRKKKEEKARRDALFMALEEAQRLFQEASQAVIEALDGLDKTLAKAHQTLTRLESTLEQNAVTLSDGTKVYFDTESKQLVYQDPNGQWQRLEAERLEEAKARLESWGGKLSTKQGKEALEQQRERLSAGEQFILNQYLRLAEIDQSVEHGILSLEDATRRKQEITRETEEYRSEFKLDTSELPDKIAPIEAKEQAQHEAQARNEFQITREAQKATDETRALFGAEEGSNSGQPTQATTFQNDFF